MSGEKRGEEATRISVRSRYSLTMPQAQNERLILASRLEGRKPQEILSVALESGLADILRRHRSRWGGEVGKLIDYQPD